jgi:hypothetical protein
MRIDLDKLVAGTDLRKLAAGAVLIGATGSLAYGPPATAAEVAPVPAPTAAARQAARAVLDGVGIESGLETSRVQNALDALAGEVTEQSDPSALRLAFQAYFNYQAAHPEKVRKSYLYYVDYGLDSRTPRGYVFDMKTLTVVDGPFTVAHGRGSAAGSNGVPTRFSNRHGSNATSLGLYLAQETYGFRGKSGGRAYSSPGLRLTGVSGEYNSAARARGVVVHGAPYVTASRAGRSEGCPAVEMHRARKLIPQIANGGMVFLFSPLDREWMAEDRWASLGTATRGRG